MDWGAVFRSEEGPVSNSSCSFEYSGWFEILEVLAEVVPGPLPEDWGSSLNADSGLVPNSSWDFEYSGAPSVLFGGRGNGIWLSGC